MSLCADSWLSGQSGDVCRCVTCVVVCLQDVVNYVIVDPTADDAGAYFYLNPRSGEISLKQTLFQTGRNVYRVSGSSPQLRPTPVTFRVTRTTGNDPLGSQTFRLSSVWSCDD